MKTIAKTTQKRKKETTPPKTKNILQVPIYDIKGKEEGKLSLPNTIFSIEAKPRLLSQYMRVYLANQRQGTASTKTQSEVAGSTRKIYRQKGTGRARHGSIKAPIFVGGGIVGGPKPRDFSLKLNKKQKKKALFYSLSLKAKEGGIAGLSNSFLAIEPKTKIVADFLKAAHFNSTKILIILPKVEKNNLILAIKNIRNVEFTDASSLNVYDVLTHNKLLMLQESLSVLEDHFLKKHGN